MGEGEHQVKLWKKVILGLFAVLLLVAGYIFYIFFLKEYDTADEEVDTITKSEYDIVLPDVSSTPEETNSVETSEGDSLVTEENKADSEGEATETVSTSPQKSSSSQEDTNKGQTEKTPQNSNQSDKKENTKNDSSQGSGSDLTANLIVELYRPSFENLQSQANSRIDALINKAISEYKQRKSSGQSISYGYFYQKYKSAADVLEEKTDTSFNVIIKSLEKDLEKHGFDSKQAQQFWDIYNNEKQKREDALLTKAKDLLM